MSMLRTLLSFIGDPRLPMQRLRALPTFFRNLLRWKALSKNSRFPLYWAEIRFQTYDRYAPAGELDQHYFLQDIWAARQIIASAPPSHVDVGSRLDGFVGHLLCSVPVTYVDLRPLTLGMPNFRFVRGSILELPFEDSSVTSLSCLHVIEHIGLGRYGDPLGPNDYLKALAELERVLAPGAALWLSTPVGRERVCFDAHRVFSPNTIRQALWKLDLEEFSMIPDNELRVFEKIPLAVAEQEYACGLFRFRKMA